VLYSKTISYFLSFPSIVDLKLKRRFRMPALLASFVCHFNLPGPLPLRMSCSQTPLLVLGQYQNSLDCICQSQRDPYLKKFKCLKQHTKVKCQPYTETRRAVFFLLYCVMYFNHTHINITTIQCFTQVQLNRTGDLVSPREKLTNLVDDRLTPSFQLCHLHPDYVNYNRLQLQKSNLHWFMIRNVTRGSNATT